MALFSLIVGAEGLFALADKNGVSHDGYAKAYAKMEMSDRRKRRYMVEELLARIAEKGQPFDRRVKEVVGMIRAGLRKLGLAKLART
jgi:hypothetical protein